MKTLKTLKSGGAIIWALSANILIAVMKFVCASLGSMAMLSEGVHSLADSANEITLMAGKRFSHKEPSRKHPWGQAEGDISPVSWWQYCCSLQVVPIHRMKPSRR